MGINIQGVVNPGKSVSQFKHKLCALAIWLQIKRLDCVL